MPTENAYLDKESSQNLNELRQYTKSLIPFVGAGMSVSSGYMTWYNFLDAQIDLLASDSCVSSEASVLRDQLNNNEYLAVASGINKILNNGLYSAVRREFSPKESENSPEYISCLRKIGCTTTLTTNYDSVLESNLYINKIKPEKLLPYSSYDIVEKDKQGKPLVIKLHGTFDNPSSIVLTDEQYIDKYVRNNEIKKTLQYFWTSKVLLFLGCSLEKDYLIEFISQLAHMDDRMYHYAVLPEPKDLDERNRKTVELDRLKIRPIWYPNGKHDCILDIIKYLEPDEQPLPSKPECRQVADDPTLTMMNISRRFLDSHAVACAPTHRNKLFYSIINTNNNLKKKRLNLSSVVNEIYQSKRKNTLCLYGEPGTGKSTLLTLLYLESVDTIDESTAYIPAYLDLHHYENWLVEDAVNDLVEVIADLKDHIAAQHVKAMLFIDGIDEYPRHNKRLADIIFDFVKEDRYIAKTVYSVGNIINSPRTKNSRLPDFPRGFERTIKINLINTQEPLFYQITEHLLRIYNILPKVSERSKVTDKIRNLANMASGNFTDFRTVSFLVLQYKGSNEVLDHAIGEIYTRHYSSLASKGLNGLAEQVTKLIAGEKENFEYSEMVLFYKSPSIRNFMYAHHYVNTVINQNAEGMKLFDCIFPPCVNGFAKSIINSTDNSCAAFISGAASMYAQLTIKQQTQILYFFGRVKFRKNVAIDFLVHEYYGCIEKIDSSSISENDILMTFRTIGIALIYLGNRKVENDFYQKLIYHPKLRRLNRLFHIDYYTNDEYFLGEERNLEEIKYTGQKIERMYNSLYNNIINEPKKGQHSYYLSIITIIDLAIYDHYHMEKPLNLYCALKYGFKKLMDKLAEEKSITNHTIKNYISSISLPWESSVPEKINASPIEDENIYNSLVLLFYRLKTILRSGWLKSGRRIDLHKQPESVADHSWACGLLAMYLLSENINMCSFMQDENLDEYKNYNKQYILEMLLVHDLAESYTGDIIGDSDEKSKLEKEFTNKIKVYDSFPYLRSFHNISLLIEEYSACATINARVAHDIDKIEPLIQLYLYKDLLENPNHEIPRWEKSVDAELKTTLGRKIYEFILINIAH